MNTINFSNGKITQLESSQPYNAIELANSWLNEGVKCEEAIAAACAVCTGCRWAAVSQLKQGSSKVKILALIDNGEFVDCFSYDFNQTPCEKVLGKDKFCHFSGVQHAFPEDEDLKIMGVADYAGASFKDDTGEIAGHVFVMSENAMANLFEFEDVITSMTSLMQLEWPSVKK